ncbi:LysR family transcriptional regulator [Beijerinckia indica]|uniref:Transcriptional regulator, LysR family n=1 Tax=Beijerinckia indica subsp. indica (strain ATCC 9039 / DSM 1715 / NCIMB 8712) TaxID=395963 RepID=B2II45_BEII9|nr:LysR family transcriptional regulator [Beijerinckia indica]ACB94628.1 transcriptional regulator, LysR family [Beijerinckia indica subsp. indica ATCC 9039]
MLDPLHLQTFLHIAEGHSFSETGRRLGIRQSTVSDHVRKLEEILGHQLFVRDTHHVTLTLEGEALVAFATGILAAQDRALRHFAGTKLRGRLRLGVTEDLILSWLPQILNDFVQKHPQIDLSFTIALSNVLIQRFDAGELDLVLCKRWAGEERGELLWRDQVVWVGANPAPISANGQLLLILYPAPSLTRFMALSALESAGISWHIACTSDSLSGVVAAARAGMGIFAHSRSLIPSGLVEITSSHGLPKLNELDFVMLSANPRYHASIGELTEAIRLHVSRRDGSKP